MEVSVTQDVVTFGNKIMKGMIKLHKAVIRTAPKSDTTVSLKQERHSSWVYTQRDTSQETNPLGLQFSE